MDEDWTKKRGIDSFIPAIHIHMVTTQRRTGRTQKRSLSLTTKHPLSLLSLFHHDLQLKDPFTFYRRGRMCLNMKRQNVLLILIVLSMVFVAVVGEQQSLRRITTKKGGKKKAMESKKPKQDKKKKQKKKKKGEEGFDITLINMMPNATNAAWLYDKAFEEAKERWEEIIVGDLPGYSADELPDDIFPGAFDDAGPVNIDIDDVAIGYAIIPIDGPGKILGQAGPRYYRLDGQYDDKNNLHAKFSTISAYV